MLFAMRKKFNRKSECKRIRNKAEERENGEHRLLFREESVVQERGELENLSTFGEKGRTSREKG